MTRCHARIVLAARSDGAWIRGCEEALGARGIETVNTYSCWSAEFSQAMHGGEAFVMDAHLLCGFVSADRPGPVLRSSPELPVVVFNADELDERRRRAAMAHDALLVDGDDPAQIACCLDGVLSPSGGPA